MSTIQLTQPPPSVPEAVLPARRAAGLLAALKAHMLPCFGLLTFFLVVDVASFVGPFYASRFSESPWGAPERMDFLARAMGSALAFGFVAAVAADRRNRSGWWFLLGHAGFPLAILFAIAGWDQPSAQARDSFLDPRGPTGAMAAVITAGFVGTVLTLILTRKPLPVPAALDPLMGRICRLMFRWGNIWFGITLMAAIGVSVATGTFLENRFGAKGAQYLVYRSPWFGAIFFTGGVSMLCATFRKYPFRLEQGGWLTVHTGLALVVIGGMGSFLSSVDGNVSIREGETADTFLVATQTRLALDTMGIRPNGTRTSRSVLRTVADFDVNPTKIEPERIYDIPTNDGEADVRVVVDRYFAMGMPYSRWSDDGPGERLGLEIGLTTPRSETAEVVRLDEQGEDQTSLPFGQKGFGIALFRATPKLLAAVLRAKAPADHGRIVVKDAQGAPVLVLPVKPAAGERLDGSPAQLQETGAIPGVGLEVKLVSYYDNMRPGRMRRAAVDASPGNPQNPAVLAEISGPKGADRHVALAYRDDQGSSVAGSDPAKYPYTAVYEAEPRIDVEGPQLLFAEVDGRMSWIYVSASGARETGEAVAGADLPLPMPAFKIRPTTIYRKLRIDDGFEFRGYKADDADKQVIRLQVSDAAGVVAAPIWLSLGGRKTFALGDRNFTVSWAPTARALGFALKLTDFHRDFYPGSSEESSFESYCVLRHFTKYPKGEDIKIDMNHPLRLDGWRLFQSRFGGGGKMTILQVNRDPGLVITYPACAVVLLGLVVVFFMKKTLRLKRQELEMRGAAPGRHLAWAIGSVAAVGIGPLVFGLYAGFHERLGLPLAGVPAFVFGVVFLIAAPITVVWIYARPMARRLAASLASPVSPGVVP